MKPEVLFQDGPEKVSSRRDDGEEDVRWPGERVSQPPGPGEGQEPSLRSHLLEWLVTMLRQLW